MIADNFALCFYPSLETQKVLFHIHIDWKWTKRFMDSKHHQQQQPQQQLNIFFVWMFCARARGESERTHTHTHTERETVVGKWINERTENIRYFSNTSIHIASGSVQPPSNENFSSLSQTVCTRLFRSVQCVCLCECFFYFSCFSLSTFVCVRVCSLASDIGVDSKFNHYISTLRLYATKTLFLWVVCIPLCICLSLSLRFSLVVFLSFSLPKRISLSLLFLSLFHRHPLPRWCSILFLFCLAGKWRRKCICTYTNAHTFLTIFRYIEQAVCQ